MDTDNGQQTEPRQADAAQLLMTTWALAFAALFICPPVLLAFAYIYMQKAQDAGADTGGVWVLILVEFLVIGLTTAAVMLWAACSLWMLWVQWNAPM